MEYKNIIKIVKMIKNQITGLYLTGSIKQKIPFINKIEFITLRPLNEIISELGDIWPYFGIRKDGKKHKSIHLEILDLQIDIWKSENKYELFYKKLLKDLDNNNKFYYKKMAINKGLKLTKKGLFRDDKLINVSNRKELKEILNIT
jgi:hypothetical protein